MNSQRKLMKDGYTNRRARIVIVNERVVDGKVERKGEAVNERENGGRYASVVRVVVEDEAAGIKRTQRERGPGVSG